MKARSPKVWAACGLALLIVPAQKSDACSMLDDGYAMLISDKLYDLPIEAVKKRKPTFAQVLP